MSAQDAQRCLDRASVHVCRGDYADAVTWLDRARGIVGESGREQLLRGLAQAQAGKHEEATESLRRATLLDPYEPRAFYNYACLLTRQGDRRLAAEVLAEALRLRPGYKDALRLKQTLESESSEAHLDPGEPHTIGWVIDAGPAWTKIGWGIAALALAMFVVSRFVHPIGWIDPMAKEIRMDLYRDPVSIGVAFLTIVSGALSFAWVITDLIDRRGRALWLVPMIVGTFCIWGGLAAIAQALYMLVGRK